MICKTCNGQGGWNESTGYPNGDGGEEYQSVECHACFGAGGLSTNDSLDLDAALESALAGESAALERMAELEQECRAYDRDRQATRPLLENVLAGESAALDEVATHKYKLARIASILDRLSADLPRTNAATWEAIIKIHAVIEETSDAG